MDPLRRDVVSVPVIIIVQVVICGGVRVFSERSCEVCVPLRMMRFTSGRWWWRTRGCACWHFQK